MRFQVDKTTRHDCDGDCLQTAIDADEPTTALDVTVQGNYPVVERHSARNGIVLYLFHTICRSFQLSPIGL
jgi:hypothetical protein